MKTAILGVLAVACVGTCLNQGCLPGREIVAEASLREKCIEIVRRSDDKRLVALRKDPEFQVPFAVRLREGGYLCAVKTSKGVGAVLLSNQGDVLHIEPRVLWGPRGYIGPLIARLRPVVSHEQVVLCVPKGLLPYVVDLKILDWDGHSVSVNTITRFTYGYVKDGKPYGVIPALLRVGLDCDQILLLRKSADPKEPPEVAEVVLWDEKTASFRVQRFRSVLVGSEGRQPLREFTESLRQGVEESRSAKHRDKSR